MSSSTVAGNPTDVLEAALSARVISIETAPHAYATTHTRLDADGELDDGRSLRAILKETGECPPDRPMRRNR